MDPSLFEKLSLGSGLLVFMGWIAKLILPYFLKKLDEKDQRIDQLVNKFTDVQNHKTTEMTTALGELKEVSSQQTKAIESQIELIKHLINK